MRYTIKDLQAEFSNDDTCLEWLVNYRYPDGITCGKCEEVTKHHKIKNRKAYSCDRCGNNLHPMAGTVFEKSTTPLSLWFYAMYLMANTRAGISAKQLERELGVTYKTAWRMFHQIRKVMGNNDRMKGDVEIDEMYFGPIPERRSTAKTGTSQMIFGAVERGGRAKVVHVTTTTKHALLKEVVNSVDSSAQVYSDGHMAYRRLDWAGYRGHKVVNHGQDEYVNGEIHTQNVENLWSNMKRGIKGVYRHVDAKYLQAYADEYAFRYSHRNSPSIFWVLMAKAGQPSLEDHKTVYELKT
jgi:transposase